MEFCKFIECRLGEPITALDVKEDYVLFGSISGYFGIFNAKKDIVCFSEECEKYLIRSCCLDIGTQKKFVNQNSSSRKEEEVDYVIEQDTENNQSQTFGGKSELFEEAANMVFEYDEGEYNLGYIGIGDSSILRIDVDKFMQERLEAEQNKKINENNISNKNN